MPVQAAYPAQLPTFVDKFDLVDVVFADHINALQREVLALATALGTSPAGNAATTVRQRMENNEASIATITSKFDGNGTLPQTNVTGLPSALGTINNNIAANNAAITSLQSQVSNLQSSTPASSSIVHTTGTETVAGAKTFQDFIRLTSQVLFTSQSTNHPFQIGPDGGLRLAGDYMGFSAYDGSGPAELRLNRDGGPVYIGGDLRVVGNAPVTVDALGPQPVTATTYSAIPSGPSITVKVTKSGRVRVDFAAECAVPAGQTARVTITATGGNTLAADDRRSAVLVGHVTGSRSMVLIGLQPGNTTFTMVAQVDGGVAQFSNMTLTATPLL